MSKISEIIETEYGPMICAYNDINQTGALRQTKKSCDYNEIEVLKKYITKENPIFVDVGANLGTYTLGLAKIIKEKTGKIICFEPQRVLYYMLCGSIILNNYENIFCYNLALSNEEGEIDLPNFDYSKPLNFGSIEFGSNQVEKLSQQRQESKEKVKVTTLDIFLKNVKKIDILKIDVEGMEIKVLEGSKEVLQKFKPILLVEYLKNNKNELQNFIKKLNYEIIEILGANYLCKYLD